MKKVIQSLLIVILLLIIVLIITVVFNPFNLRTKLVSSVINSYLTHTFKDYKPLENSAVSVVNDTQSNNSSASTTDEIQSKSASESSAPANVDSKTTGTDEVVPAKSVTENNKNPLLSVEQEKQLESYGVDVSKLPKEITPGMEACFTEILGKERVDQIVKGDSPSVLEFLKVKDCLGK